MGSCCGSCRRADIDRTPFYYYCPQTVGEREPLPFTHAYPSTVSTGILFNTNLESSIPDAYRSPSAPLPRDASLTCSQTLPGSLGNCGIKSSHLHCRDSQMLGEPVGTVSLEVSDTCRSLKDSECRTKPTGCQESRKVVRDEPSKMNEPTLSASEDDDVCPTCLEEYDLENPRIITKCEHHFHLSCILEWMERSDTCPICDQLMMFNNGSE